MTPDEDLALEVGRAVKAARDRGARSFHEVLQACEGAPPAMVDQVLRRLSDQPISEPAVERRETSELAALFPAADPLAYQWWYTIDTIEGLANRVHKLSPDNSRVAFLGTPTVGYQYSRRAKNATVFDIDRHVLAALAPAVNLECVHYDVANPIPEEHSAKYDVVLTDPPWYPQILRTFLQRALDLAVSGASVLCSLPPRLTRPGIAEERQELLECLREAGVEIVSLDCSVSQYLVPRFEQVALDALVAFEGRPWRSGDLLHLRRVREVSLELDSLPAFPTIAFARNPKRFRVFVGGENCFDKTLNP